MMRLIDANELIEHMFLGTEYDKTVDDGVEKTEAMCKAFKCGWNDALDSVEEFASIADTEPVRHGHWIRSSDGAWAECSKCHASIDISMGWSLYNADGDEVEHDWCPHCGAKMDEVENENISSKL